MQYLIGIGVADPRNNPWVCERPLKRMVRGGECALETAQIGSEDINPAGIHRPERFLALHHVQCRSMSCSGFSQYERSSREIERGKHLPAGDLRIRSAPMQAS